jgi:hypothetical protein
MSNFIELRNNLLNFLWFVSLYHQHHCHICSDLGIFYFPISILLDVIWLKSMILYCWSSSSIANIEKIVKVIVLLQNSTCLLQAELWTFQDFLLKNAIFSQTHHGNDDRLTKTAQIRARTPGHSWCVYRKSYKIQQVKAKDKKYVFIYRLIHEVELDYFFLMKHL